MAILSESRIWVSHWTEVESIVWIWTALCTLAQVGYTNIKVLLLVVELSGLWCPDPPCHGCWQSRHASWWQAQGDLESDQCWSVSPWISPKKTLPDLPSPGPYSHQEYHLAPGDPFQSLQLCLGHQGEPEGDGNTSNWVAVRSMESKECPDDLYRLE